MLGKRNWSDVLTKVDDWSCEHMFYLGIVPHEEVPGERKQVSAIRIRGKCKDSKKAYLFDSENDDKPPPPGELEILVLDG